MEEASTVVSVTIGGTVVAVELERTVVRIRLVAIVGTNVEGDQERKLGTHITW